MLENLDNGDIISRYELKVIVGSQKYNAYGNDIKLLKGVYDKLVEDNINNRNHVVIVIYDNNKDTNIYSFDSEQDI